MGPALHLIARLYAVEERAKGSQRRRKGSALRQRVSAPVLEKLHQYLLEIQRRGSAEESSRRGRCAMR